MSTRSTCPYCGVGCGILATRDGQITGDPEHPANFGRLCSKGSALGETLGTEGRLLAPQIGGCRASWNDALDLIATGFTQAIAEYGPDAVAFYVSGQLLAEDYYVANKLMKGFIGSANIDTNSRLCMASSVAGHKRAFGSDTVPGTYEDLEEADLVVLVGSNLAWCHPVLYQRLAAAKSARPGLQVINIDPRQTATSQLADLHLQIAPDGDIALFNGLLMHLAQSNALNTGYIDAHVTGCDAAIEAARQSDPAATGLSAAELQRFYRLWSETRKVVTVYSQGVNQSACGTDKVNAILNCHLATGRIGRPGCGPLSVTGQPNAMGGREVGGLANMLANHLDIENPEHRDAVQSFWKSPQICQSPGLKAVDLFDACADGRIKALWIMSTNPAVSLPDAAGVAEAIAKVPLTVVTDIMARTDTGDLADVLLPAAGWGEKDGTVTNSERRISRQRAFLPVPGEARPDWQIICDVATRMGWGDQFAYRGPGEIFQEYVQLSMAAAKFGRALDLSEFEECDYAALTPQQWPRNNTRFFADGGFFHADGKARMLPISAPELATQPGFRLNTGRVRDQWHTMTRTGKSPRLGRHMGEPYVEIHPRDANVLGVKPAGLLELRAGPQSGIFRTLVTTNTAPGTLFVPMHWTRQRSTASTANKLVRVGTDPVSGQPALKSGQVSARLFPARWYGYLASASEISLRGGYGALARTATGWQAELAGRSEPDDWTAFLQALIGRSDGDISSLTDQATGSRRYARHLGGSLEQLFFVSKTPVALARDDAIARIGSKDGGLEVLSGLPSSDRPDQGAIICACLGIGRNTINQAINDGARDLESLSKRTGAGTNCGSCKPELQDLLALTPQRLAAE